MMDRKIYLRFWLECARESWRGSLNKANTLSTIFGGAILAGSAWWFGLTKDAPSSIEGTIGFALVIAISSLLLVWIVIFIVSVLGAPARLDSRKIAISELEHMLPGRFVFDEFVYGGDFGLMCLNLNGKFDIEQIRNTFTEIKVAAPAKSLVRVKISFMNGRQNADRKCHFYVLGRDEVTPRMVENMYEEQKIRLDERACFKLKFVPEESYMIHDQASLRVTVSSWSR